MKMGLRGGLKDEKSCAGLLYQCGKCGAKGCTHIAFNQCGNQAFKGYMCLRCGMMWQRRPIQCAVTEEKIAELNGLNTVSARNSSGEVTVGEL